MSNNFKGATVNFDLTEDWEKLGIKVDYIYCTTCSGYRNRVAAKDKPYFGSFTCKDHK